MTRSRRQHQRILRDTVTKEGSNQERDWSKLPPEILHLISRNIREILDFVRFRAVCPRWRISASVSDMPRQLCWFIKHGTKPKRKFLRGYSICTQTFPSDSSRGALVNCPMPWNKVKLPLYCYLLAFDWKKCSLSLLNPLTRREIALPPMKVSSCSLICMGNDPIGNTEYVLVSAAKETGYDHTLWFCKIGDVNWKPIKSVDGVFNFLYTYYDGMLFVHEPFSVTKVYDVATDSLRFVIPPPDNSSLFFLEGFQFFVESCGKLIAVVFDYLNDPFGSDLSFEIYELDYVNGNPRWVEIKSLGDQFLILSMSEGGLSLQASEFPVFRRNCIYFLVGSYNGGHSYLSVFDISNGFSEQFPFCEDVVSFFVPNLQ